MSNFPPWYPVGGAAAQGEPTGWDRVELGGIALNGRASVTGEGVNLKIDPRATKGATAGKPTTHGMDTAEWTVRIVCWTAEQMRDVDDALPLLCPPTNLLPVTFDHPQVRSLSRILGGLNVMVKNAPTWLPSSNPRGWEIRLRLQWWPVAAKQAQTGKSTTPKQVAPPASTTRNAVADAAAANPQPTTAANFAPPVGAR